MGDFEIDSAVQPAGDGRYTGTLSKDWEIWGPMGGYVCSLALRAAGAESSFDRPASFFCHYLGVARFEEVHLEVTKLRGGRTVESWRVQMTQPDERKGTRNILDATVCTVADNEGLEHEVANPPDVPEPGALKNTAELMPDGPASFPFWRNFEARPIDWSPDWPPPGPRPPQWRQWERFVPRSTFDDPWTDAARVLLLTDLPSWPSTVPHHGWKWGPDRPAPFTAPSLDLYVAFHQLVPDDPWLLVDGTAPIAAEGLLGWHGRIWSSDLRLVASGGGQGIFRPTPG